MMSLAKRRSKFKQALVKVLFTTPILIWQSYAHPVFTGFHYPWNIITSFTLGLLSIVLFFSMLIFSDIINPLLMRYETIPGGFTIQKFRPTKIGVLLLLTLITSTILFIWHSSSYYTANKTDVYLCMLFITACALIDRITDKKHKN